MIRLLLYAGLLGSALALLKSPARGVGGSPSKRDSDGRTPCAQLPTSPAPDVHPPVNARGGSA